MKWFYNLKLSSKLMLSFLLVAAIAGFVGYVGLTSTQKVSAGSEEMYSNAFVPVRELSASRSAFLDARIRSRSAISVNSKTERMQEYEAYKADFRTLQEHLDKYLGTKMTDAEKTVAPKLQASLAEYRRTSEPALEFALAGKDKEAEIILNGPPRVHATDAMQAYDELVAINDKMSDAQQKQNQQVSAAATKQILIFLSLGTLAAFALGWMLTRIILGPIRKLQDVATRLAKGDVDVHLDADTTDEIGHLTESVRNMADLIKQRARRGKYRGR